MKSKFFEKIVKSDEQDIDSLNGFAEPDEQMHQEILVRYQKALHKDILCAVFWCIMCTIFIIVHIEMYADLHNNIFLLFSAIFFITALLSIYRLKKYGFDVVRKVKKREYKIRKVRVGHTISRFIAQSGRPSVKIVAEGHVYSHEFSMNRRNRRIYKKDPDAEFVLIQIDRKHKIYSLTYIS